MDRREALFSRKENRPEHKVFACLRGHTHRIGGLRFRLEPNGAFLK